MKKRSQVKLLAISVAGALAALGSTGCDHGSATSSSRTGKVGGATFLLSATSASGKVYRLRSATFDATGSEAQEIRSALDPANPEETVTASLLAGLYQITLRPGWRMFEVPATGGPVEVPAQLVSPNPIAALIASGRDASVIFQFQVGGEMVPPGTVTIGIGVTQLDGGLPPDGSPPSTDPPPAPVIIPESTHVADDATTAVLTAFDPETGTMRFSASTALLTDLAPGDVLVSAPSPVAPAGYLRKVMAVGTDENGVVLETVQANLTDAISQGVLDAHGELMPADVQRSDVMFDGVTVGAAAPSVAATTGVPGEEVQALGVGENFHFEMKFNHVFIPMTAPGAGGSVTVDGSIQFNIGWGIHVGISPTIIPPFVSVDSFQASAGFSQSAHLSITGEATGMLGKEVLIASQAYTPVTFFIGPVPVVVVPRLNLYLSAGGQIDAKVTFEATEAAAAQIGARWTDDDGWQDISSFDFAADAAPPTFTGILKPRASAKIGVSFTLYDIAGPELSLDAGLELDGHIPRNPTWVVNGFLVGTLTFRVKLPVIGTVAEHKQTLFNTSREFSRAGNALPTLDMTPMSRPDPNVFPAGSPPTVGLRVPVDFTPGCAGILGGGVYYRVNDAEDGCLRATIASDRDGALPYKFTFQTVGRRVLTITAVDSQGASVTKQFTLNVVNTNPTVTFDPSSAPSQGEPRPIRISIVDPNEKDPSRLCANTDWKVEAPDTLLAGSGCLRTVTFGATGPRQVTVSTHDNGDAAGSPAMTGSQVLTLNVLPPPANPFPLFVSATLFFRDQGMRGVEFCPVGAPCCIARAVPDGATIDLTKVGCGGGAPYFVEAVVEGNGEPLTYEWSWKQSQEPVVFPTSAPHFDLVDNQSDVITADPCRVDLSIKAPEASRNKGPLPAWSGTCIHHERLLR